VSAPQVAALPPDLNLWAGCVVRVAALDATTGSAVGGVVIGNAALEVMNLTGGASDDLVSGDWKLVPGPGVNV
jgi:hypothetical protein